MSDEIQAKADLPEDAATVSDPLDPENSTESGTSELAEFEQEMLTMSDPPMAEEQQGDTPAEPEQTEEETGSPSTEEEESPEGGENSEPDEEVESQAREQMRPRLKDPLDIAVASLAKAKGISLIEAAKIIDGTNPTKREDATEPAEPEKIENSQTIDQQLKELRARHSEATRALEFETAAEIFEEIEALRDKQVTLKIEEVQEKSRTEQRQAQEFESQWKESNRKAAAFYPDAVKPDSPMYSKIQEIDAWMQENQDPIFNSPDKPFILSKMAAAELGVPMARPAAKAKAPSAKSPIEPASGNARTAPVSPQKRMSEELDSLDSLDAFEAHIGAMSFG